MHAVRFEECTVRVGFAKCDALTPALFDFISCCLDRITPYIKNGRPAQYRDTQGATENHAPYAAGLSLLAPTPLT